jgi:hypothetical protein
LRAGRAQVVASRLRATHLDARLPAGSLVRAAWCGLQDSAPRSALLALHARVDGVGSGDWEDLALTQVWGPRGAVYVVPAADVGVFTLGLLPRDEAAAAAIEAIADHVRLVLDGRRLSVGDVLDRMPSLDHRDLRMACRSGQLRIRWDGRDTEVEAAARPRVDPVEAQLELARRFLRVAGPPTPEGFAWWAGIADTDARATWDALDLPAAPPAGLAAEPVTGVRLLPPGDPFLATADRELLVPDASRRRALWPPSTVWPGGLLVDGELAGTWRRRQGRVTVSPWSPLDDVVREAVEREAAAFPLPHRITLELVAAKGP